MANQPAHRTRQINSSTVPRHGYIARIYNSRWATNMSKLKSIAPIVILVLGGSALLRGQTRAAWMQQAQWGVMTHYLADWQAQVHGLTMTVDEWNKLVDGF